uniref:Arf-GAP with coiled-coil, ANK repeat and PH domain-containing protein n=1 Tax=Erpetoichthys calabaricus TaxID=27687 RepID=A0A8C4SBV0_ERPCA
SMATSKNLEKYGMIETGKAYISANKLFVNGVKDLSQQCKKDEMISVSEQPSLFRILFDQAQRSVKQQLHNFVKEDVRKFKETKKHFDKVREDMEIAQVKNAQAPRNKPHEVEEATGTLNITRKCFRHLALDYVLQVKLLWSCIFVCMLSFMHAQYTFFQQGYNLLDEIDPYLKKLAAEVRIKSTGGVLVISLQDFSYDDYKTEFNVDAPNGVVMEGYLFKRASNAFKTWNRRWFSIQNSQLVYQKKLKDVLTVVVEDLRLCSVKPCEDIERRFCFEVVSPSKSCMLQAESEKLRQAWIHAVQASIASAYRESPDNYYIEKLDRTASPSTSSIDSATEPKDRSIKGDTILQRVQAIPGNQVCCDCGQADPRWASINLGILLCIECSGIHRSLGVHCSKVRSLTLDSWEPELLKLMCELGNITVNHIYEAGCEELGLKKPTASSSRKEKEEWIKAKYVEKKFLKKMATGEVLTDSDKTNHWRVKKCHRNNSSTKATSTRRKYRQDPGNVLPASISSGRKFSEESSGEAEIEPENSDPEDVRELHPGLLIYKAALAHNLPVMAEALAHGADINWVNDEDENKTPLIQAVIGGSLIACEFLLQNGADVNQRDLRGPRTTSPSTYLGHTGQVCLFLKRGANQHDVDEDGQDPLSIAVEAANADIVTLLRLARMNEEMRESEGPFGQPGDTTYLDIFREFSHMASNSPEKLNRRSFHFSHSCR